MELVNSPLAAKILDLSIALFVLLGVVVALAYAFWKQWQYGQAQQVTHAAALAEQSAMRLKEANDFATNRQHASEQQRSTLEQLNKVLSKLDATGTADTQTRKMLLAICEKLELPLKDFLTP